MGSLAKLMTPQAPRGPQSKEEFGGMIKEFGNPFDKSTWENKAKPQFGAEQASAIGTLLKGGK